jgi:hypothetical protein
VYKVLEPVLLQKNKAEEKLQSLPADCGMAWTIIRPGGLKSEPATGKAVATGVCGVRVERVVCGCLSVTECAALGTHRNTSTPARVTRSSHTQTNAEDATVCGAVTRDDVAAVVIKTLLSKNADNKVREGCVCVLRGLWGGAIDRWSARVGVCAPPMTCDEPDA